jgi:hypothetical protein
VTTPKGRKADARYGRVPERAGACRRSRSARRQMAGRWLAGAEAHLAPGMAPEDFRGVRTISLSWSPFTESNRRPSPYHLVAPRSMPIISAGRKIMMVRWGRCGTVRLLYFAAAPCPAPLTFKCQLQLVRFPSSSRLSISSCLVRRRSQCFRAACSLSIWTHAIATRMGPSRGRGSRRRPAPSSRR